MSFGVSTYIEFLTRALAAGERVRFALADHPGEIRGAFKGTDCCGKQDAAGGIE
jgi:hypothetical protein